jgi:hypothetical protein
MAKLLSDIKAAANELASRAKRGQYDERGLVTVVNDLVNHLHAQANPPLVVPADTVAPVLSPANAVDDASGLALVEKPKRGRKSVTSTQTPAVPEVTVGTAVPTPTPVAKPKAGVTTSTPINIKVGRGVTVGTKTTVKTGVTVGSAPVNPAGQITVGGRIRKV